MKNLVIVESPTKAKTIGKFLGPDYTIIASMGHIMDLPKSKLGVDVEKDFDPDYVLMPDKKKSIAEIKKAGKTADRIILATDLDREGEAIAGHVAEVLREDHKSSVRHPFGKLRTRAQDKKAKDQKLERIIFHEITKEAIEEALKNPRKIDENLVNAQTARRVLDRLVGYKLSPVLWQKVRRGLSAGRVQSVALRLIVEREREIERFKKEPYFTISVNLKKNSIETSFELIEIDGQKIEETEKLTLYDGEYRFSKTIIDTDEKAENIKADLASQGQALRSYVVSDVLKKETKRTPPPPYTTSTLQQDASRRMGLSGKRTMQIAQKLYEEGYITYHRTDSVSISDQARKQMSDYVRSQFGEKYLSEKPRFYKVVSKTAQEAHESIRPAKISIQASAISNQLGSQFAKLYELIWRRALATVMADAVIESTSVFVTASSRPEARSQKQEANEYRLKTNGSVLLFDGFLKINPQALEDRRLPEFKKDESLGFVSASPEPHETLPPPRYNEASLIKTLEEKGIGRPSTYASIISVIEERAYVEKEEGRFHPTPVGEAVNDFLVLNFSTIDDIPFTAEMEGELDLIADGKKKWKPVIADFYKPFEKTLEKVKSSERVKIETEKTDEKCPTCSKGDVVIRTGRFGKFLSCSRFPECKYTAPFVEETELICPKDSGKIVIKKSRRGRKFYGCSNYPDCTFAAWKLEDIKNTKEA